MYFEWDLEGGAESYRRALELNPNLPDAHAHYGWYYQARDRRSPRALDEVTQAKKLDPFVMLFPLWKGFMLLAQGRADEALVEGREACDLDPRNPQPYQVMARAYRMKGMHAQQLEMARKAAAAHPVGQTALAVALYDTGRRDEARQIVEKVAAVPNMDPFILASTYTAIGERDEALKWIERMIAIRHVYGPWMTTLGDFDPLLDDARFKALLARVKPLGQ
jgi:tetratricopeptide (TPR) repeat protein